MWWVLLLCSAMAQASPRETFDQFLVGSFANLTGEVPHALVLGEFSRKYLELKWDIVKYESWDLIRACAQKGETECHIGVPKVYSLRLQSYLFELGFAVTSMEASEQRRIQKSTETNNFATETIGKKLVHLRLDWSSYVLWY